MKAQNTYLLPVPKDKITEIVSGESDKAPAHVIGSEFNPPFGDERKSIDYYCPEGTPIFAAADGEVVWTRKDSSEGGRDKRFASKANGITIRHAHDEYTNYLHLRHEGVLAQEGQRVKKGEVIGHVGMTGWTPAPHLHFSVLKLTGEDPSKDYVTLESNLSS
jgi:murein DD-endopeptidase MepM/ murein hydrolase activator NlpD